MQPPILFHLFLSFREAFKCSKSECEKSFSDKRYLRKHEKMHSADYDKMKKYLCGECGQRYATSNSLKSHMRTHSDDRPFGIYNLQANIHIMRKSYDSYFLLACEYCPAKFRMKIDLRTHTLIHTGEKPFRCHCGKEFRHRNTLKQHKSTGQTESMADGSLTYQSLLIFRSSHYSQRPYRNSTIPLF